TVFRGHHGAVPGALRAAGHRPPCSETGRPVRLPRPCADGRGDDRDVVADGCEDLAAGGGVRTGCGLVPGAGGARFAERPLWTAHPSAAPVAPAAGTDVGGHGLDDRHDAEADAGHGGYAPRDARRTGEPGATGESRAGDVLPAV